MLSKKLGMSFIGPILLLALKEFSLFSKNVILWALSSVFQENKYFPLHKLVSVFETKKYLFEEALRMIGPDSMNSEETEKR